MKGDREAHCLVMRFRGICIRVDVVDPARGAVLGQCEPKTKHVCHWTTRGRLERIGPEHPVQSAHRSIKRVARLPGDEVACAGDGVIAEEGALRSFQHIYAIEIQERGETHPRAAVVDVVFEGGDRLIKARVAARTDAADKEFARGSLIEYEYAGHRLGERIERGKVALREGSATDDLR